jgi:hypothetical protein
LPAVINELHFDGADCLTFLVHLIVRKAITGEINGLKAWLFSRQGEVNREKEGLMRHAGGEK